MEIVLLIASDVGRSQNLPQVKLSSRDHQAAVVQIADGTGKARLQFRTKRRTLRRVRQLLLWCSETQVEGAKENEPRPLSIQLALPGMTPRVSFEIESF